MRRERLYQLVAKIHDSALMRAMATSTPQPEAAQKILRAVMDGQVRDLSDADLEAAYDALRGGYRAQLDALFEEGYDYTMDPLYLLARTVAKELGLWIVREEFEWMGEFESTRAYDPREPWLRLHVRGRRVSEATDVLYERLAELDMDDGLTVSFLGA